MLREPTEVELEFLFEKVLSHAAIGYDPVKAHEYYIKTRKLKGREPGASEKITEDDPRWNPKTMGNKRGSLQDPRTGKSRAQIAKDARTKQRKELSEAIDRLSDRLNKLEALIKKREHEEKSENRKSKAKRERAAKEKDKPKSAAEKAEAARESEKYRDKHKQEIQTKAKKASDKSGGGGSDKKKSAGAKKHSVSELKTLATKVKGQIAVAKQKLAAL